MSKTSMKTGSDGGSDGGFHLLREASENDPQKPRGWGLMCGIFLEEASSTPRTNGLLKFNAPFEWFPTPFPDLLQDLESTWFITKVWGHRKTALAPGTYEPKNWQK